MSDDNRKSSQSGPANMKQKMDALLWGNVMQVSLADNYYFNKFDPYGVLLFLDHAPD